MTQFTDAYLRHLGLSAASVRCSDLAPQINLNFWHEPEIWFKLDAALRQVSRS